MRVVLIIHLMYQKWGVGMLEQTEEFFAVFKVGKCKTVRLEKFDRGFKKLFANSGVKKNIFESMNIFNPDMGSVRKCISDVCGDGRWWLVTCKALQEYRELHGRCMNISDDRCIPEQISMLTDMSVDKELSSLLDAFLPATIISRTTGEDWYLSDMNECMAEFVKTGVISSDTMINSTVFKTAVRKNRASFGRINFNGNNHILRCLAGVHPMLEYGEVRHLLVYLIVLEEYEKRSSELLERLTQSEKNVIQLVVEGLDNKTISAELNITEGTVKRELYACYRKLGVCSRVEALMKLYEL